MLNMIRRIAILVMMASMVCFVSAVSAAEPIKVGAAINLMGPASSWGQYHAKGQQDYFKYVNEVKGGVAGRKIEMILVDTGYKVPEAIAAVRKFADQSKVDIIATWGAGEGLAAKPIIQSYKIPTINFSTSWEILEPPIGFMYLPFGSYRMDCFAILEYVRAIHKGKDKPKVGLLTYNNAYGRSIHKPSKEYAAANGINIVAIEEFPPQTVDLSTEMLKLKKSGAEYVFMQMLPATIVTVLKSSTASATTLSFSEHGLLRTLISLSSARGLFEIASGYNSRGHCPPTIPRGLDHAGPLGNGIKQWTASMPPTGKAL